jgi:hypothetical protein
MHAYLMLFILYVTSCMICHMSKHDWIWRHDIVIVISYMHILFHYSLLGLRAINVEMEEDKIKKLFERMDVDKVSEKECIFG